MIYRNPVKAVHVLDLVIEVLNDGANWIQGQEGDRAGNHCLVGALRYVRRTHGIERDGAGYYLKDVISRVTGRRKEVAIFNDHCKNFAELRRVILEARAIAAAEMASTSTAPAAAKAA